MMSFFVILFSIHALPNGSPRCQINVDGIARGMNAPDQQLGYALTLDQTGPGVWNIRVDHPSRPDYQGLLLYVTPVGQDNVHLGSFVFRNSKKWKFQPQQLCALNGVSQSDQATVTHANPERVGINRMVNFTWRSEGQRGPFVAQAVVASLDQGATGIPRWHKVENVSFGGGHVMGNGTTTDTKTEPTSFPTWNSSSSFGVSLFIGVLALL
jgi:hypothetical protein